MVKNFKISIITVTKNSEKFLQNNIDSLKNQSYQNFEHIIIDGASTDKTLEIITIPTVNNMGSIKPKV